MALLVPPGEGKRTSVFTPDVMKWQPRIWLLNLKTCQTFWNHQAKSADCDTHGLFEKLLMGQFDGETPQFLGVTASHPWPALLLLHHFAAQEMTGLIHGEGPFGKQALAKLPWTVWLKTAYQLAEAIKTSSPEIKRAESIRSCLEKCKKSLDRLGFSEIGALQEASVASFASRFGPDLAKIWCWTWPHLRNKDQSPFPWTQWLFKEKPQVYRNLDFAHREWQTIAPLLVEDLDRLIRMDHRRRWGCVTRLRWLAVWDDMSETDLALRFRYPHNLHQEVGHHRTCLNQGRLVYFHALEQQRDEGQSLGLPLEKSLVSWKIIVEESFDLPQIQNSLFAEYQRQTRQNIKGLENRLEISLQRFQIRPDYLPEEGFEAAETQSPGREGTGLSQMWRCAGIYRPLLIYRKPKPVSGASGEKRQFLERTRCKLWREKTNGDQTRDYYRLTDGRGRSTWVYQNQKGQWFKHGVFA